MKILVTGATGVLGGNLVRELLQRNYEVSVFLLEGESETTLESLPIHRFYGNILIPESLNEAFKANDVVIHCAASTSVFPPKDDLVNKINIEGSRNVCEACLQHDIKRLIAIGSANSFGNGISIDNPGTEESPFTGGKYGLDYIDSKRIERELVFDYVEKRGLPALVVNPTFMIGPYDSKPSSGRMIIALYKGKVPGYTGGGKNYIAVKDVAVAIANAITMGKIGEAYILGNENLTFKDAFAKFAKVLNVKPPRLHLTNFMTITYGNLSSISGRLFNFTPSVTKELARISTEKHYYSSEKAQKELKLPQTPIEIAVKDCFEWFKENEYLT